jgi:hypothetical protein
VPAVGQVRSELYKSPSDAGTTTEQSSDDEELGEGLAPDVTTFPGFSPMRCAHFRDGSVERSITNQRVVPESQRANY